MDRVSYYSFVIIAMVLALPILSHILRRSSRLLKWCNLIILGVYMFANLYSLNKDIPFGEHSEDEGFRMWRRS